MVLNIAPDKRRREFRFRRMRACLLNMGSALDMQDRQAVLDVGASRRRLTHQRGPRFQSAADAAGVEQNLSYMRGMVSVMSRA